MNKNILISILIAVIGISAYLYLSNEDISDITSPTTTPTVTDEPTGNNGTSPTLTPADQEMTTLLIYFNNMEKSEDCSQVYPVQREVFVTQTPAQTAINLLIAGPTAQEKGQGYVSNIAEETALNSINIDDGTATVDFNESLDTSGSCAVQAVRAQITETLQQFPTVQEVEITINGESEEILQP